MFPVLSTPGASYYLRRKINTADEWRVAQWSSTSHTSQDYAQVPALKGGGSPQKRYQRRETKGHSEGHTGTAATPIYQAFL